MLIDCSLGHCTYLKVNSNSCNYMTPNYDSITPLVSAVHGQAPFPWACFDYVWFVRSLIILQPLSKSQASVSNLWVTWWRSWLSRCLTSQKVAGSISGGVIGISHRHNPSRCTMALGSTQPLNRNEYQKCFLGGKGIQYIALTTLPPSCIDCLEIWEP